MEKKHTGSAQKDGHFFAWKVKIREPVSQKARESELKFCLSGSQTLCLSKLVPVLIHQVDKARQHSRAKMQLTPAHSFKNICCSMMYVKISL
jgi:hypothetical protein